MSSDIDLSEKEIKLIKSNSIGEEFVGSKNPKFDDLDSNEIEIEDEEEDDDVEEEDDSEIIEMFNEISKGKEFITLKQVINILYILYLIASINL